MAQVRFKIGNLSGLNTTTLPILDGQFIVAKDSRHAEIYVDAGDTRLRVGDFETYATLDDLNNAYDPEDPSHSPSTQKLYYIQQNNVLAVWSSKQGAFVQVNDCGITDIAFTGDNDGNYITGATLSANGRTLTLNKGTLATVATSGAAADVSVADTDDNFTATTVEGVLAELQGNIDTLDGSLAAVAKSGDADDVSYDNSTSGLAATDVQAAIDEVAGQSAGGVASKTVYITETSGGSSDAFSKRYGIYQGATGSTSSPVPAEKLTDIDIPKDMVVEDGSVVDVVFVQGTGGAPDKLCEGDASGTDVTAEIKGSDTPTAADAGKYIKLTIANASASHLWIKATDLVDIYTTEQNASQIQLTIDSNNVISAVVVAGSIGTTELADDSVTAAKVNIAAHTEANAQSAGADGLLVSVTTTDGQVSAVSASIAANTYESYGAVTTAIEALDADLDASGTAQHSGTFVVSGVTEVDGVLTAVDSVEVENAGAAASALSTAIGTSSDPASADTIYGAKAYADNAATAALQWGTF